MAICIICSSEHKNGILITVLKNEKFSAFYSVSKFICFSCALEKIPVKKINEEINKEILESILV